MEKSFQFHGEARTDSALYPWILGSITRSLFYFGEAVTCRTNKGASAICAYYSLFHLGLFLMFGCPRHLNKKERKRINKGLRDGTADPNPEIRHSDLVAFLRRAVAEQGLPDRVLSAVERAKEVRETINYGPRVLSHSGGQITVENCTFKPDAVDAILTGIPGVYDKAVPWACRNGERDGEFDGAWIAIALSQADAFFIGPASLYGEWCSVETAQVAEQMRQSLAKAANQIAFGRVQ